MALFSVVPCKIQVLERVLVNRSEKSRESSVCCQSLTLKPLFQCSPFCQETVEKYRDGGVARDMDRCPFGLRKDIFCSKSHIDHRGGSQYKQGGPSNGGGETRMLPSPLGCAVSSPRVTTWPQSLSSCSEKSLFKGQGLKHLRMLWEGNTVLL